jgi:hypothetical protein
MVTQPDVYASVVKLLAEGNSPGKVNRITCIDKDIIRRIREQHPETLEVMKTATLVKISEAKLEAAERLVDELHEIPIDRLAITFGILVDKGQLLSGEATSRHEVMSAPSREDLAKALAALPSAQARVVESAEE